MSTTHTTTSSPLGPLTLVATDGTLSGLYPPGHRRMPGLAALGAREDAVFGPVVEQLQEYFAGQRTEFSLPLRLDGTPFQRRVWRDLIAVPFGQTRSYAQVAAPFGTGHEVLRAVGAAMAANPVLIVVPCHRVVAADGGLKGYAAGLERKRALLEHEGALVAPARIF